MPTRPVTLLGAVVASILSINTCFGGSDAGSGNLDAICKTSPIPPGFVAVGEIDSPVECKAGEPGSKNAWLIDKVREGVVACVPPNYTSGFPPAISYMVCGKISAENCPPNIDGSLNGFLLKTPASCDTPRVKANCWPEPNWYLSNYGLGVRMDIDELGYWMLGRGPVDKCQVGGTSFPSKEEIKFIEFLEKGESLPVCALLNASKISEGKLGSSIQFFNIVGKQRKFIVIRQFYTTACSDYEEGGVTQKWNAFVVQKLDYEQWKDKDLFMCSSSLRKRKPKSGATDQDHGHVTADDYEPKENYSVKKIFQDDRCGMGDENNAYIVRFSQ